MVVCVGGPMKCERCGLRDVEVHFTVIRDTAATEQLCIVCSGTPLNQDLPGAIKDLYDFMLTEPDALTQEEAETVRGLSEALEKSQDQEREP